MPTPSRSTNALDESFVIAQWAVRTDAAAALVQMAARYAANDSEVAKVVREREDLQWKWRAEDKRLSQALAVGNKSLTDGTREKLRDIVVQMNAANDRLRTDMPKFAELASIRPVSVVETQKWLDPNEALVAWTVGDVESYAFVVRKDRATFFRVPLKASEIAEIVRGLRESLDRRGRLPVEMPPFDTSKAYALYQQLLAPAEPLLAGATSLNHCAGRCLAEPAACRSGDRGAACADRRRCRLQSGSMARAAVCADRDAGRLVIDFVTPIRRGAPCRKTLHRLRRSGLHLKGIQTVSLFGGSAANVDGLRHLPPLPPLPDTASELRAEAQALGAPATSVYLRQDATVTKVKSLNLSDERVVAFATHGLVAKDVPAPAEPALALTPPAEQTKEDDGLLRASVVSQLKLNADWVVLSACNTAAADGTPGAEGFSGLAKAFFYAGARSLLVSHWPVDSAATVKLTTSAFHALESNPAIGRAEAFHRAMLAMIDGAGKTDNPASQAHPFYWAPFVVIGEGGRGK